MIIFVVLSGIKSYNERYNIHDDKIKTTKVIRKLFKLLSHNYGIIIPKGVIRNIVGKSDRRLLLKTKGGKSWRLEIGEENKSSNSPLCFRG